jgi:4-diphosphocytidyl-2-C-methyl-D-erythritol kinase
MHRAYAKINLGLSILGKRTDGYHEIETVLHRISWHDELSFESSGTLGIRCNDPSIPTDERNICFKAAHLLRRHLGTNKGVIISIAKSVPAGAGLGGGSADAGVVLRTLPEFWGYSVADADLERYAATLGSDVPFFLHSGTAVATGRGEQLEYFDCRLPFAILTCYPGIHVSTSHAYGAVRGYSERSAVSPKERLIRTIARGDIQDALRNDFEPVVFAAHPEVRHLRDALLELGADAAALSGSGSSVYGLFRDPATARSAEAVMRRRGFAVNLTPSGITEPQRSASSG